ncbi:hypothetical protein A3A39_00965, partial [Candidatus Kaiserbacteria bacterium RIFCSPLOWO2_01_FULL_54_13]
DVVAASSALSELDNGDLRASVLQKEAAREAQQAKLSALRQGTRPEEIAVSESSVESASASLDQARRALLEEMHDVYRSADDAIHNKVDQFFTNPRSANPQLTFLVADSQIENNLEYARLVMETALGSWQMYIATLSVASDLLASAETSQKNLNEVTALLAQANTALNRGIQTGSVTQSMIDGYIVDVASARSSIHTAGSALTSAVTAHKDASAALETAKKNLALKKAGTVQADIDAQEAQVKASEADLANARAQLSKTIMRAPFAGIVTKMDLKVGSIASANVSEVSMISTGTFQIESFVPEINIALIEVEDEAAVTLDAYGGGTVFAARVVSIDPAETVRDGVSMYRTILQFDGQDERIRSGMTANVVITTDERENVLSIPRGVVVEREGKKYVRVSAKGGSASGGKEETEEREVTTGAVSSLGSIEILSGLSEGDLVVLSK